MKKLVGVAALAFLVAAFTGQEAAAREAGGRGGPERPVVEPAKLHPGPGPRAGEEPASPLLRGQNAMRAVETLRLRRLLQEIGVGQEQRRQIREAYAEGLRKKQELMRERVRLLGEMRELARTRTREERLRERQIRERDATESEAREREVRERDMMETEARERESLQQEIQDVRTREREARELIRRYRQVERELAETAWATEDRVFENLSAEEKVRCILLNERFERELRERIEALKQRQQRLRPPVPPAEIPE